MFCMLQHFSLERMSFDLFQKMNNVLKNKSRTFCNKNTCQLKQNYNLPLTIPYTLLFVAMIIPHPFAMHAVRFAPPIWYIVTQFDQSKQRHIFGCSCETGKSSASNVENKWKIHPKPRIPAIVDVTRNMAAANQN